MKAYIIEPPFSTFDRHDERALAATKLVVDIVFDCLRRDGDSFQHSVVWVDPGEEPGNVFNHGRAVPHIVRLDTDEVLLAWLRLSIDPNRPGGGDVRSIATCRTVTFGYDGQAFLCLRHEDPPPSSPDLTLAIVQERSEYLAGTDYFDGGLHSVSIHEDEP
jgi:hypothetical protein